MKWIDYKDPPYNIPVLAKADYGYKVLTIRSIILSEIVIPGSNRTWEEDAWFEGGNYYDGDLEVEKWCYIEDEDVE